MKITIRIPLPKRTVMRHKNKKGKGSYVRSPKYKKKYV